MSKKVLLIVPFAFLISVSMAFAGFKKPGMDKKPSTKSSGGSSVAALVSQQKKVEEMYVKSNNEFVTSLEKTSEALGVKSQVSEKLSQMKSLKEGNLNSKSIQKNLELSKETKAILDQEMASKKQLNAQEQALMTESLVHLALGLKLKKDLVDPVKDLNVEASKALKSASPTDKPKASSVAKLSSDLATNLPSDLKLMSDTLSTSVEYAKSNDIKVPKDATKLLSGE